MRGGNAGARPQPRDLTPARGIAHQGSAPNASEAARAFEAELERRFDGLEQRIEQLKVRYHRYFAGDPQQRLPPDALHDEIDREMRQLRTMNMRRSADNFRLGTIEARLSSYREMFQRRLRAVEEGKVAPRHAPQAPAERVFDVDSGVTVSPRCEPDAVEAIFQGLARRNDRAPTMDLDTFRGYIEKQVAQIREKTGCDAVQFRLVTEEGKVKLKARPVGGRSPQP